MTKRIVRNARSVSQPVKIFDATKFVCSSNASNPVVFKPVSNFASDCQSVKPVRKLTNVNRKRPHENGLLMVRAVTNLILQNHLVP